MEHKEHCNSNMEIKCFEYIYFINEYLNFVLFFRLTDSNRYDMLQAIALDADTERQHRVVCDTPCNFIQQILYRHRAVHIDSWITTNH